MKVNRKVFLVVAGFLVVLAILLLNQYLAIIYNSIGLHYAEDYLAGESYDSYEKFTKAESYFLRAIKHEPEFAPANANIAYLYMSSSNIQSYYPRAIKYAERAIREAPQNLQFKLLLLTLYETLPSVSSEDIPLQTKSEILLDGILKEFGQRYLAHSYAAYFFYLRGDLDKALEHMRFASKTLDQNDRKLLEGEQRFFIGVSEQCSLEQLAAWLSFDLGNSDIEDLRVDSLVAWVPDKSEFFRHVGDMYYQRMNYVVADSFLLYSLGLEPKNSNAHESIARLYHSTRKYEEAIQHYQANIALNKGKEMGALLQIGLIKKEQGDYVGAIQIFRKILKKVPKHSGALSQLQGTYALAGMKREMLDMLKKTKARNNGQLSLEHFRRDSDYKAYLDDPQFLRLMTDSE